MVQTKFCFKKKNNKKSCFECFSGQKAKAKSIILRFRLRLRTVVCCTGRQTEVMLLTLISKGGEDLEQFKRFQRLVSERSGDNRFGERQRGTVTLHCNERMLVLHEAHIVTVILLSVLCLNMTPGPFTFCFSLSFCLFKSYNCP